MVRGLTGGRSPSPPYYFFYDSTPIPDPGPRARGNGGKKVPGIPPPGDVGPLLGIYPDLDGQGSALALPAQKGR